MPRGGGGCSSQSLFRQTRTSVPVSHKPVAVGNRTTDYLLFSELTKIAGSFSVDFSRAQKPVAVGKTT